MRYLSMRSKQELAKRIGRFKKMQFPDKGGGVRLADELGVSPQVVSSWINGKRLPTLIQLYHLAKVFDVSPLELCGMKRKNKLSRQLSHISVLSLLMEQYLHMTKCNVSLCVKSKIIKAIKLIVVNEIGDIV